MVRTLIVLLLLAVFFLSGTLYGMNQNAKGASEPTHDTEEVVSQPQSTPQPKIVDREVEVVPVVEEDVMLMDQEVHLTQKTASVLETSVQGFYEIVVGILYQVAELFF